jgi:hypothetical protein
VASSLGAPLNRPHSKEITDKRGNRYQTHIPLARAWGGGEVRLLIVFIALGLHGDRHRQRAQKALAIGSVLTGGIDADVEMCLGMLLVQPFHALAES